MQKELKWKIKNQISFIELEPEKNRGRGGLKGTWRTQLRKKGKRWTADHENRSQRQWLAGKSGNSLWSTKILKL